MASSISTLQSHVGYWMRFVSNQVSSAFQRRVEACGVTVAEWVVLRELWDARECRPGELAESLGLTRGAISKLVDRLVAKNLIARSAETADRRAHRLKLTQQGLRLVPRLAKLADQNDAEFFGHLSDAQRAGLVALMQELVTRHGWKECPTE